MLNGGLEKKTTRWTQWGDACFAGTGKTKEKMVWSWMVSECGSEETGGSRIRRGQEEGIGTGGTGAHG